MNKDEQSSTEHGEHNRYGGLTLVPLPAFIDLAMAVKQLIEKNEVGTPVDIVIPKFPLRASGEPFIQLGKEHVGGHDCVIIASGPGTYEVLGQLQFTLGYLVGRRASRIALITGYLPHARSDKDEGSLEFALASHVIHLLLSAAYGKLDRIIAVDLHAPQVVMAAPLGIITEVCLGRRILSRAISEARRIHPERRLCLLLPDDGADKKYQPIIEQVNRELGIDLPVVCGQKRRRSSRQSQLRGLNGDVGALANSLVIGFDDEIATGGTNIQTAKFVKEKYGASIYWAVAMHGVLCGEAGQLLGAPDSPIERIFVSETIPQSYRPELTPLIMSERLEVIPWAEDLAHIIFYHHWDTSIRERR